MIAMKIVGIGLNKTGTKTLGWCMKYWGFSHVSCSEDAFKLYCDGDFEKLLSWVDAYDSFEDWPWPLFYQLIDRRFPGSKFILTRRKDPETWFASLCAHADRTGPAMFRKHIYGHEMPHAHKEHHIKIYIEHLSACREYFKNRQSDFLEVCFEDGDGWGELASFLGLPLPLIKFPHENRNPVNHINQEKP
ncbi:MAG: hypothetical protein IJS87_03775 [Rhodocyclaceae bacterium]|nr:hypothetical protein [Rhodocyclaceae bacterium]